MYYLLIWLIVAFSAIYNYVRDDKYARLMGFISYLALALTAGLRFETGTDYIAYAEIYENISPLGEFSFSTTYIEPLYALICSIFRTLAVDLNIMFLLISLITTAVLLNSFKLYIGRKYYLFAVILYFGITYFLLDMSGVRQAIALSLFIYSIRFVLRKRMWTYLFIIIIAFLFHRSSALLIIVYPLSRLHIKSWIHYLVFGVGLVLIIMKIPWLMSVFEVGTTIFLSGPLAGKLSAFIGDEFFSIPRTITPGLLIYVPIYLIAVWRRKDLETTTPYFNTLLNLSLCFMVTLFYLYESNDISIRFSSYFSIAFAMTFALQLSLVKQNRQNLLIGFSTILFISIFAMRFMIFGNEPTTIMYRPYQNYILYEMGLVQSDAQKRLDNFGSN